jgi:hypothetical protein
MITTEKLKIYDSYGGDCDGLTRVGRDHEKKLFDNDDWSIISSLYQDIELIKKGLAAQTYIDKTIDKLKLHCDKDSFAKLSSDLPLYNDFQKLVDLLVQIKLRTHSDTDVVWAGFDNVNDFLADLNHDINRLGYCDFATLEKVNYCFFPTGKYQEISISNGWGDDFIKLADNFDKLYNGLTEKKNST